MRKTTHALIAITGVLTVSLTNAYAADVDRAIQGTWKGKFAESCQAVKYVTTEDLFILHKKKIERYEGSCAVTQTGKKNNEFILKGICETEGETSRLTMRIRVLDKNHVVVDGEHKYERCR